MTVILKQFQAIPPPAFVKAVEEICVTCGGAYPNTVANPKGELKAITTRSGLVLDGPFVPMPSPFINPEEDERVEETLTNMELAEYTIKEQLIELANTPLNENCSAVILKKLPEKLGDPGKFLIPCGFSELKCKALADLGASPKLMPTLGLEKLGIYPSLFTTQITRDLLTVIFALRKELQEMSLFRWKVYISHDFVIVDYESDPRVPLILGRPFLRTAQALIDVHGEEMILRDGNERLILNMRNDTSSYSNEPHQESINMIDVYNVSHEEILKDLKRKIKNSKLLIDELDLPESSDFLPFPECDSVFYEDFSKVNALPLTNNKDKVFNPGILIHENLFEVTNLVTPKKNVKKATNASLILEDFYPHLYELPFHKEVPRLGALLSFSSKNKEKVFNPGILTSKRVHSSLLPELSHWGPKAFKVIKIIESPMEIFPCSYGEDIRILDVPCLHFYPP
ncbi:reverse transcriptase domain-containing protein [Tanacetum coccineum]